MAHNRCVVDLAFSIFPARGEKSLFAWLGSTVGVISSAQLVFIRRLSDLWQAQLRADISTLPDERHDWLDHLDMAREQLLASRMVACSEWLWRPGLIKHMITNKVKKKIMARR